MRTVLVGVGLLPLCVCAPAHADAGSGSVYPELPRLHVDTNYSPSSGRAIAVHAGGDFQGALNSARPGDVIMLEAGAVFTGPFTLPDKPGSGWITIRSSAPDASLPPPGSPVTPSYARLMPKLVAGTGSVIATAPQGHHYRFIGIEIRPRDGVFLYALVQLGSSETSVEQLPHHIIFDHCYLHGDPRQGTRRGILMNSRYTAVIDSYLSDFKEVGADTQAIAGWNGPGPFKIVDNELEAAGENIMFGGAVPTIPHLIPSDIEIRGNHVFKALSWRMGDPAFAGIHWSVKNLFELKNAQRVLVDGNVFETNWADAQNGFALLFTVRGEFGAAPWAIVADVTFTHNIIRRVTSTFNISGYDDTGPSQRTERVLIKDNLMADIGAYPSAGVNIGWLFLLGEGTTNMIIDHNTALQTGVPIWAAQGSGRPITGFVFTNNIIPNNQYGVSGDGTAGSAQQTLRTYFSGYVFKDNVIVGGAAPNYPSDNFFPPNLGAVGFVKYHGGAESIRSDYNLGPNSPYRNVGTDRKDLGADFGAILSAMPSWLRTIARP